MEPSEEKKYLRIAVQSGSFGQVTEGIYHLYTRGLVIGFLNGPSSSNGPHSRGGLPGISTGILHVTAINLSNVCRTEPNAKITRPRAGKKLNPLSMAA